MKKKTLIISSLTCLLPIFLGLVLWNLLPDELIRHFGPGSLSFSPKGTVIFWYPLFTLMVHLLVVFKPDWINIPKNEKRYWYIPIISNVLFLTSFALSIKA